MSSPGSERARRALAESLLSGLLSLGAGLPPPWRLDLLRPVPAAMLMVGEPTPSLAYRPATRPG